MIVNSCLDATSLVLPDDIHLCLLVVVVECISPINPLYNFVDAIVVHKKYNKFTLLQLIVCHFVDLTMENLTRALGYNQLDHFIIEYVCHRRLHFGFTKGLLNYERSFIWLSYMYCKVSNKFRKWSCSYFGLYSLARTNYFCPGNFLVGHKSAP